MCFRSQPHWQRTSMLGNVYPHRCSRHPLVGHPIHVSWKAAALQPLLPIWLPYGFMDPNADSVHLGLCPSTYMDVKLCLCSQLTLMGLLLQECTEHMCIPMCVNIALTQEYAVVCLCEWGFINVLCCLSGLGLWSQCSTVKINGDLKNNKTKKKVGQPKSHEQISSN